jgi:hypothetical protein
MFKLIRCKWGEKRGVYRVLVGKSEEKRPFGRTKRRWEGNIKTDLLEVGSGCMDWIELAQDREKWWALVNEHWGSTICGEFLD